MRFISIINSIFYEAYLLLDRMSPYILFGFLFAGVFHAFISTETVSNHLGKRDFLSVIKAALFGIPLPLCSCSVIPAAMSLKREGASKGALLSFLISTPTSGVDSIFATYSLLGGFFALYRVIASFLIGTFAGIFANIVGKNDPVDAKMEESRCKFCEEKNPSSHDHNVFQKIKGMFKYAFGELLYDSGPALMVGVFLGGIIAYFMPSEFIHTYLGSGIKAKLVMMVVGIPMYVCATASIPIVASLLMKGLDPGAAFVFLVSGPATNVVTMAVIGKNLGKRTLLIYLISIMGGSVLLGVLFDKIATQFFNINTVMFMRHHRGMIPGDVSNYTTLVLIVLILWNMIKRRSRVYRRYFKG